MVEKNCSLPFSFYCLTEDKSQKWGYPLDLDLDLESYWWKIQLFNLPWESPTLYFDLDIIIFNNVDNLLTHNPGKFHIIRDFNRCRIKDWKHSNSSVMRWEAGTMNYLYEEFKQNSTQIMSRNHGDQDWIMKRATSDINWFPDDWIRSYKWEMIGFKDTKMLTKDGKKFFRRPPQVLPENNVAVFHGEPKPFNCADEWVVKNWF